MKLAELSIKFPRIYLKLGGTPQILVFEYVQGGLYRTKYIKIITFSRKNKFALGARINRKLIIFHETNSQTSTSCRSITHVRDRSVRRATYLPDLWNIV